MSDPMNQLMGGGGGPLDLSSGPPFPFFQLAAAGGSATSTILGQLAKAGGLHPDLQHSLGMLLPPTSMGLNGRAQSLVEIELTAHRFTILICVYIGIFKL
jgi:hypothetical protein